MSFGRCEFVSIYRAMFVISFVVCMDAMNKYGLGTEFLCENSTTL